MEDSTTYERKSIFPPSSIMNVQYNTKILVVSLELR